MNILQINKYDLAGGAARVMYRLHQSFSSQGQTSHLLVQTRRSADANAHTIAEAIGERRSLLGRLIRAADVRVDKWWGAPRIHRSTTRILETELFQQAQAVHLHNVHGWYFNYCLLPTFSARKPVVWTLHDMWAFTGHCGYAYDCRRWKTGCFDCVLLKEPGRQMVEPKPTKIDRTRRTWYAKRRLYQESNLHIVTPSRWLCALVEESILADALSVRCIPNGVDLNVFHPLDQAIARDALDVPLEARVILFVADKITRKRKGFSYLIEALSQLQDIESIVLLTFGAVDTIEESLQRFRRRDLGKTYDEELHNLAYNAADLFVFPTLADNQPLVLVESLASGTPIVSFNVGGVPEMARHMETGYLARYKDVEDLTQGMRCLLDDDSLRARMRQRCREIAEAEYGLDLQARRYIALYERAVEEHRRRSGGK